MNYYYPELEQEIKNQGFFNWDQVFNFLFDSNIFFSSAVSYCKNENELQSAVERRLKATINYDRFIFHMFDEVNERFTLITISKMSKDYFIKSLKWKVFS